ncbi:hypothetical protein [Methylomonas sp. MgM2]
MDLSTRYLGLNLKHPVVAASPVGNTGRYRAVGGFGRVNYIKVLESFDYPYADMNNAKQS